MSSAVKPVTAAGAGLRRDTLVVAVGAVQLQLQRLQPRDAEPGIPVLLVPGHARDSSIFDGEGGLAACLAAAGCDVYLASLRGKGAAWPRVSRFTRWGYHDVVTADLPALAARIAQLRGDAPQVWIGQGIAGAWLAACFARCADTLPPLAGMALFAPHRRIALPDGLRRSPAHWRRWRDSWRLWLRGYLPARRRPGGADESARALSDLRLWSEAEAWLDPEDGFDYAAAARRRHWPPCLYLGVADPRRPEVAAALRAFAHVPGRHDARVLWLAPERRGDELSALRLALEPGDTAARLLHWLAEVAQRAQPPAERTG